MKKIALVFPHQVFAQHPAVQAAEVVYVLEEPLFFYDQGYAIPMHKAKIVLHRASLQHYAAELRGQGKQVTYLEWAKYPSSTEMFAQVPQGVWQVVEVDDFVLRRRIERAAARTQSQIVWHESPLFLNTGQENLAFFSGRKRWFMADFYKHQRQKLNVLMHDGQPVGGRWSYDEDNRKKVPKKMMGQIPKVCRPTADVYVTEAKRYAAGKFASHPGEAELHFPHTHAGAEAWLGTFLRERFGLFGDYEDAIVRGENTLWHSVLTPMLNIGLLTPGQVVRGALEYAQEQAVPLNSLEGFVRQVIGWREFIRAAYHQHGVTMRTSNHWQHHRPLPRGFWDGSTGVPPIDDCLQRILKTGYCHHIERLMVLGGFLFLCEVDPREIYRWFMAMFADSYDWVMVPNVYAMSQNSAGGLITTKPYFSGSNYILKMSNHPRGEWCDVWDGLYWRWVTTHGEGLRSNPRWAMMVRMAEKNQDKNRPKIERAESIFFV